MNEYSQRCEAMAALGIAEIALEAFVHTGEGIEGARAVTERVDASLLPGSHRPTGDL
ncbi:hypothetical protein MSM1_09170 [Mycobacterium sp. SM1]|uniref:hypothetical protein n=1 Tax=Mycobacterium sp. SM1 TaxID=2816243 RepID=UPI001BCABDC1|nr:hypothetical protein [Mycobacterium sp. SM1]MBS4728502.1 hypothetical protein [Mycobacterium sp. SM1]